MKRLFATVLLGVMLSASRASADIGIMELLFNCKGKACIVRKNSGGIPALYEFAAREVLLRGIRVRIEGPCASACVIFASFARRNTCITREARMGIHYGRQPRLYEPLGGAVTVKKAGGIGAIIAMYENPPPGYRLEVTHFIPDYGTDINLWIAERINMPYGNQVYVLSWDEARQFWKECR